MRTSPKARRVLEVTTNIAIIAVAVIIVGNYVSSRWQSKPEFPQPKVGSQVSLPGVKWDERTTLVLVLQKGCRYCEESAAFYRRLREQRSGDQPRMLGVVPGDKTEIASYLSDQGIPVDGIFNIPLSEINVSATPTLLLVDRSGTLREVWVGKLDEGKEAEVAQRMLSLK